MTVISTGTKRMLRPRLCMACERFMWGNKAIGIEAGPNTANYYHLRCFASYGHRPQQKAEESWHRETRTTELSPRGKNAPEQGKGLHR